jgi:hypothetical protein
MERELDLLSGPGARLWEAARFRIHQRLLARLGTMAEGQVQYRDVQPSRFGRAWAYARNGLTRPSLAAAPATFLIVGHPRRRRTEKGTWTDPYVDPLLERLGRDAVVVEPPHLGKHHAPSHVSGVRYLDDIELLGAVRSRVFGVAPSPDQRRTIESAARRMADRFGLDPGVAAEMRRARLLREGTLRLYHRLLARVRPKALVVVVSYGKETLIEAAKDRGVPVVELQHGSIYPYHLGYSFPTGEKSTFPDHLLTFGRYWSATTEFPICQERISAVGYPAFEAARAGFTRHPESVILFLSQPAIGEKLSRLAVEFARRSKERVIYKLHPGEVLGWAVRYPWLSGSGVQVADDPGVPVYKYFGMAKVQVGVFSTALYEGLGFGVPTVVAQLPGSEACEPLIQHGYARAAADATELESAVSQTFPPVDHEAFFRAGALDRMTRTLVGIAGC